MNIYRVAVAVLKEYIDGGIALNGGRISAIVQVFQPCPLLHTSAGQLLKQRIHLNNLKAFVAVEGIDVAVVHKFEDVVLRICGCRKAANYLGIARQAYA